MEKSGSLNHMSFIPDGNNRWAQENNQSILYAYREGQERAKESIELANNQGVHTVTFWGLSTENWAQRPPEELDFLVDLFVELTDEYLGNASQNDIRIRHLGRKDRLPGILVERIMEAEDATKSNTGHTLNLALDYGGHDELIRASRRMLADIAGGTLDVGTADRLLDEIGESFYQRYLDTSDQPYPNPDFIVRTSGETRLSGFLPWQAAYSELYFASCYWPDYKADEFQRSVDNFYTRQRRFGGGH